MIEWPNWIIKLALRMMQLKKGRYWIILTIDGDQHDWTVFEAGKIEQG